MFWDWEWVDLLLQVGQPQLHNGGKLPVFGLAHVLVICQPKTVSTYFFKFAKYIYKLAWRNFFIIVTLLIINFENLFEYFII